MIDESEIDHDDDDGEINNETLTGVQGADEHTGVLYQPCLCLQASILYNENTYNNVDNDNDGNDNDDNDNDVNDNDNYDNDNEDNVNDDDDY